MRSFQCPACLETFPRKNNLSAHHGERKCNKKNKGGRQRISDDQRNFDGLLKKKNGDRLTVEGIKEFLKKDNIGNTLFVVCACVMSQLTRFRW